MNHSILCEFYPSNNNAGYCKHYMPHHTERAGERMLSPECLPVPRRAELSHDSPERNGSVKCRNASMEHLNIASQHRVLRTSHASLSESRLTIVVGGRRVCLLGVAGSLCPILCTIRVLFTEPSMGCFEGSVYISMINQTRY